MSATTESAEGVGSAPAADRAHAPRPLPIASPARVRAELAATLVGHRGLLAVAIALLAAGAAAGLVMPRAFGALVDVVRDGQGAPAVYRLVAIAAVGTLVAAILDAIGGVLVARVVAACLARLRERLVDRLMHLPTSRVEAAGSGDAIARAGDDVAQVTEAAEEVVPALTGSGFAVVATLVGLGVIEWRLMLALLVIVPLEWRAVVLYQRDAPPVYAAERHAMGRRAEALLSSLRGRPTVRAYGLEAARAQMVGRESWAVVRWALRARVVTTKLFTRMNANEFVGMAALLVMGYWLVVTGRAGAGVTVAAVLFFLRLFGPIGTLLEVVDSWQSGAASLRRIVGVLEVPAAPEGRTEVAPATGRTGRPGRLELRGVEFTFDGHREPTVRGVDLDIAAGSTLAVVGTSGAGKSTLAALVSGLRGPHEGTIALDGVDLADVGEVERARLVGLVTQETHVFAGTVRDNLTLSVPDASDEAVWAALVRVGADGWVRDLPEGLDEVVGAEGTGLSAMQAQHLALARIDLLDPPVVILDEATAEAGSTGAAALDAAAAAVTRPRTAIVIAHRLDQAVAADRIVVLDAGRVVQDGDPDALRRDEGPFATLWAAWSRGR